jgi:hypothetical protein
MNFLEILIEDYDLSEPGNLEDDEILVLWTEIISGIEVFKSGENLEALGINNENYEKVSNFLSEGKERNLFDESDVTKFEEFLFSLRKLRDKTIFQCQFCAVFFSRNDALKSHIDSVHDGIRLGWEPQKKIKQRIYLTYF